MSSAGMVNTMVSLRKALLAGAIRPTAVRFSKFGISFASFFARMTVGLLDVFMNLDTFFADGDVFGRSSIQLRNCSSRFHPRGGAGRHGVSAENARG